MSNNIIEVRDLGKKYIIYHQQNERYTALRDVLVNKVKNFGKKKLNTGAQEEFWALKDVSFDIKPGDKVGIIGRNGAGKSTLLKLLSRITEPSTGSIKINGRVASLLEVGTGFHPELTGRENIFLNGAILGMSKQEIKKKFDEIVEFAEVEKFLDTPVKRYSSGMYVRLAFSVAAHLEPEILIVDEVLAVGDAQFQKKCLGKMGDVSKEGRTVLFVSHNIGAIKQLCNKGILLHKGKMDVMSTIDNSINTYYNLGINQNEVYFTKQKGVHLEYAKVCVREDNSLSILAKARNLNLLKSTVLSFVIYDNFGTPLFASDARYDKDEVKPIYIDKNYSEIRIDINNPKLRTGKYQLSLYLGDLNTNYWVAERCIGFDYINLNKSTEYSSERIGSIIPECKWNLSLLESRGD